uniref:class II aldolase/adducin family protein n=1 Tax=Nocardia farcinica TaxID=37329 RepID=UPI0024565B39
PPFPPPCPGPPPTPPPHPTTPPPDTPPPAPAAVVHVHAPFATALATWAGAADEVRVLRITDYELIKGLGGTDPTAIDLAIFPNWRDVPRIAADIERRLAEHPGAPPVLCIAGHGITTWGENLTQARDRAECLEALCELVLRTGREHAFAPQTHVLEMGPT